MNHQSSRNDFLKLIAVLTMLIDHIGVVFFPSVQLFRIVGRIALPIFCYQLAMGYRYTSNKIAYMFRLWMFALVSQLPYMLIFNTYNLNILFTFLLSLFVIDQLHQKRRWILAIGFLIVWIPEFYPFIPGWEYHWYGLFSPILFFLFSSQKEKSFWTQSILLVAYVVWGGAAFYQLFAMIGIMLVLFCYSSKLKITLPKYFFYVFYPAHLLVLLVIHEWIGR